MKKVRVTEETFVTKYQANDGTMFDNEQDCKVYEESYVGILKSKYLDIPKKSIIEQDFFAFGGSEEYLLQIVDIRNDDDIDTILKLHLYFNSHIRESEERIKEVRQRLENAKGGKVIIGRGFCYNEIDKIDDESFSVFYSVDEWFEHLKTIIQKTE